MLRPLTFGLHIASIANTLLECSSRRLDSMGILVSSSENYEIWSYYYQDRFIIVYLWVIEEITDSKGNDVHRLSHRTCNQPTTIDGRKLARVWSAPSGASVTTTVYSCHRQNARRGWWELSRPQSHFFLISGIINCIMWLINCHVICLTFRRRIKSRLPFAGIIRRLSYSTRFQDKG